MDTQNREVYWAETARDDETYHRTAWFRSVDTCRFVSDLKANGFQVVGVIFDERSIGFVLGDLPPHAAPSSKGQDR